MPSTTHTQKPTTFSEFLACTRSIPEYRRPHYLRWVDLFLNSQSRTTASDDPLDDTQVKQFLQDLSRRKEDRQVRQAEEAIALYRFYQTTLTQAPPQGDSLCADSSHWDTAQTRLIEALRLKHRSLSTEQSYQSIRLA